MILPPDARLRADVGKLLEAAGESARAEVLDPLLIHLRLLASWNDAYGLTRITDWPQVLDRHVRESLLPLRWIAREPGRLLDVGSGNGFPALPILACRPHLTAVLLERSERKGLFLDAVVRESGWSATVLVDATDAESFGRKPGSESSGPDPAVTSPSVGDGFDHVISRATLSPERFLDLASGWARPGGRVYLFATDAPASRAVSLSGDRVEGDVGGRRPETRSGRKLKRIVREPISRRRASYLHIFEVEQEPGE